MRSNGEKLSISEQNRNYKANVQKAASQVKI